MKIKIDPLDSMFSKLIRKQRPVCEVCHRRSSSQVHHFKSRRYNSVRFSYDNIWAVCFTCHRKFHEDPNWGVEMMKKRLGNEYEKFCLMASYICRRRDFDKKLIKTWIEIEMQKEPR